MAFDFPANPSLGQPYVASGITYIFDGIAWNVAATPQAVLTADSRNRIYNPAMWISQENGGNQGSTNGYYTADQWQGVSFGLTFTTVRYYANGEVAPRINMVLTAKASLAAADYTFFMQRIEGLGLTDILWGTALAKPMLLRFETYCDKAGAYSACIQNADSTRSFVASFTLAANTWTTVTIPVPGDTTGTWTLNNNVVGVQLYISCALGSNYLGVAGWQAGNKLAPPGMTNGAATGCTFWLRNVGLYLDPLGTGVAPPFEVPDYADELTRCMRYWQNVPSTDITYAGATGNMHYTHILSTPLRTTPSVTFAVSANYSTTGPTNFLPDPRTVSYYYAVTSANVMAGGTMTATLNARM